MPRTAAYPALVAALVALAARADAQLPTPVAARHAAHGPRAPFVPPAVVVPQAAASSDRGWIIAGTAATAAFGGFVGWALADEEGDVSCLGGPVRSALNGTVAGTAIGLPLMTGLMALDARNAPDSAARDSILAARARRTTRGWALVRYKVQSMLIASAGSAVVGGSMGAVAGGLSLLERPKACRNVGHAIGEGSASYGGAMIGLTVPMAVLFDWPH